MTSRAVREAARIVNTQLSAAQSQALANGRSAGVWIERVGGTSSTTPGGMDLYMAEVPPPYSGDTSNSTVTITVDNASPGKPYYFTFGGSDSAWQNLPLRPAMKFASTTKDLCTFCPATLRRIPPPTSSR